jgi:hypothetical protein
MAYGKLQMATRENFLPASEKIMSTSAIELCSLTHGIIFERPLLEGKSATVKTMADSPFSKRLA